MTEKFLFSSESVTNGHPDKVCDQISDAVLDAVLQDDPQSRVACETFVTTGLVIVGGEITTETYVEIPQIARETIRKIGYTDPHLGFHWETAAVVTTLDKQSPDIAMGVDREGAGDQGLMFGYATRETEVLMPLPITLAHRLTMRLKEVRENATLPWLKPDGKAQVTVEYDDGKPVRIQAVVVSTQHGEEVELSELRAEIQKHIISPVIPENMLDDDTDYHINPTGRFVLGGPVADTGLTGRKIIVDTYGGVGSHGGGCFSGKDATKVDRSASYMARYIAKNIVAAKLADKCEIQIAYAIGVAEPVSVMINTYDTGEISNAELTKVIRKVFPLTPRAIIDHLDLRKPIFEKTAAYGHFGRELPEFKWEKTDMVDELIAKAK
ncbi:MAG TPA: methionine adenosyltransferase [candidate division Zixibacteria bacterium]|nr:methionine adenosyltransferase [candidate division Zixibacteria bacterium]